MIELFTTSNKADELLVQDIDSEWIASEAKSCPVEGSELLRVLSNVDIVSLDGEDEVSINAAGKVFLEEDGGEGIEITSPAVLADKLRGAGSKQL